VVSDRELTQSLLALRSQADEYFPMIVYPGLTKDSSGFLQSIDQVHRAVMFNLQTPRKLADGGTLAFGQTLDRQQKLMLLRLDAVGSRGVLAEAQKTAHLMAEFGKPAIGGERKIAFARGFAGVFWPGHDRFVSGPDISLAFQLHFSDA
jgi:hypothetical protein